MKYLLIVLQIFIFNLSYAESSFTVSRCLSGDQAKSCSSCKKEDSIMSFKVNTQQQKVIRIHDGRLAAFDTCTVVDENNWLCTTSIDKMNWLVSESGMSNGKYYLIHYNRDNSFSTAFCGKKSLF
jgi:hypothetical protein